MYIKQYRTFIQVWVYYRSTQSAYIHSHNLLANTHKRAHWRRLGYRILHNWCVGHCNTRAVRLSVYVHKSTAWQWNHFQYVWKTRAHNNGQLIACVISQAHTLCYYRFVRLQFCFLCIQTMNFGRIKWEGIHKINKFNCRNCLWAWNHWWYCYLSHSQEEYNSTQILLFLVMAKFSRQMCEI